MIRFFDILRTGNDLWLFDGKGPPGLILSSSLVAGVEAGVVRRETIL